MASFSPFLDPHLNAFPSFSPAYPFPLARIHHPGFPLFIPSIPLPPFLLLTFSSFLPLPFNFYCLLPPDCLPFLYKSSICTSPSLFFEPSSYSFCFPLLTSIPTFKPSFFTHFLISSLPSFLSPFYQSSPPSSILPLWFPCYIYFMNFPWTKLLLFKKNSIF